MSLTGNARAPDDSQYRMPEWLVVLVGYEANSSPKRYRNRACCEWTHAGTDPQGRQLSGRSERPLTETPDERVGCWSRADEGCGASRTQANGQHESDLGKGELSRFLDQNAGYDCNGER